jgi:hypothetical protein
MANEIIANVRLQVGGVLSQDHNPGKILQDQTTQRMVMLIDSIGTSEETISLGTLSSAGVYWFQNLDATNYIEVGVATTVYPWKMLAADIPSIGRLNGATNIYAKANTAACIGVFAVYDT